MKKNQIIVFCYFSAFLPLFEVIVHQEFEMNLARAGAKNREMLLFRRKMNFGVKLREFLVFFSSVEVKFYIQSFSATPSLCQCSANDMKIRVSNASTKDNQHRAFIRRLKSRGAGGGIAAIFRLFAVLCHFIYQKRIFHLNMSLSLSFV